MSGIDALLALASQDLSDATPRLSAASETLAGVLAPQLLGLWFARNGFYAFESALHVVPSDQIDAWNAWDLWRFAYDDATKGALFFAEDAFAHQWCILNGAIAKFDPEVGVMTFAADTLEQWAVRLKGDYQVETGWPFIHEWQVKFGAISDGHRLAPKIPFFLGGTYNMDNLCAATTVEYLRAAGDVFRQTRHLPDGAEVRLRVVP